MRYPFDRVRGMRRASLCFAAAFLTLALASPAFAVDPPDPSWQTNERVRSIALRNGRIYVGGEFDMAIPPAGAGGQPRPRKHVMALSIANGGLRSDWQPKVNGIVYAIEALKNRVYIGGSFTRVNGKKRKHLAALNPINGKLLRWKVPTNGAVRALEVGAAGRLFMGGAFTRVAGRQRNHLASVDANGRLQGWNPDVRQVIGVGCPPRCSPIVYDIDLNADNSIVYFGGHFGIVRGQPRDQAAAVTANGARLRRWNPDIFARTGTRPNETHRVYSMIITENRAYMCGGFWKMWGGKVLSFNVVATNLGSGEPLTKGFGVGTDGDTPGCNMHKGVLYMGGHFNYVGKACSQNAGGPTHKCTADNSTRRNHVVAVNAQTGALLDWRPAVNSNHGIWTIQKGEGAVAFGGTFTRFGGADQRGIARYVNGLATV
jgi:hypothetical protein